MDPRLTASNTPDPDDELAAALAAVEAYLALEQAAMTQANVPDEGPSWHASAKLAAIGLRAARTAPLRWHTIERARRTWSGMTGMVGL